jgi:hypothetical protein
MTAGGKANLASNTSTERMVIPSFGRPLAWICLYILPGTALVIVLISWWSTTEGWFSVHDLYAIDGALAALVAGIVTLMALSVTNRGVTLNDSGISVTDRGFLPGSVTHRDIAWNDLKTPRTNSGMVVFRTAGPVVVMDYRQARAILTDSRYPGADRIPDRVAQRLGLRP